jgi:hypothetical protein
MLICLKKWSTAPKNERDLIADEPYLLFFAQSGENNNLGWRIRGWVVPASKINFYFIRHPTGFRVAPREPNLGRFIVASRIQNYVTQLMN